MDMILICKNVPIEGDSLTVIKTINSQIEDLSSIVVVENVKLNLKGFTHARCFYNCQKKKKNCL